VTNLQIEASMVFPQDKQKAVAIWAESLQQRSVSFRYAILINDLKEQEYEKYRSMHWVIGDSSPQIISYTINEINRFDDQTSEYEIKYAMTNSAKEVYESDENITVKKLGHNWFVTKHDNYEYSPTITEKAK